MQKEMFRVHNGDVAYNDGVSVLFVRLVCVACEGALRSVRRAPPGMGPVSAVCGGASSKCGEEVSPVDFT